MHARSRARARAPARAAYCLPPGRPFPLSSQYGGWNLDGVSNLFLSNGELDPWRAGGITRNVTGTSDVISLTIADGAHHLDLRASNAADPDSVLQARAMESEAMRRWINAFYERRGLARRV